jgi:NAD(P)-dependent dehydrogenase (short-subunit alcohol dehydrogenase family)
MYMGGLTGTRSAAIIGQGFEATFATNVFGTAAVTDAFRSLLSKGGLILNISSGLGSLGLTNKDTPLYLAYASSKSALNMLTVWWSLDEEKKGSGIRVVSICPGMCFKCFIGFGRLMDSVLRVRIRIQRDELEQLRGDNGAFGGVQGYRQGGVGEGWEDEGVYTQGWGVSVVMTWCFSSVGI